MTLRHKPHLLAFSLLELSVALIIIALVAGFGITLSANVMSGTDRVTTQQRLITIREALDAYAARNGYLPCPANRSNIPTEAAFGVELRDTAGTSCTVSSPGMVRDTTNAIFIGALPTATLGLPAAYAADAWSNKFLYAVSATHVSGMQSYATVRGPITVRYGNFTTNYAIIDGSGTNWGATYAVISHGPDGVGAYGLLSNAVVTACPAPAAAVKIDANNCDATNAIFYDTEYNDGTQVANFFDDYVVWGSNRLSRLSLGQIVSGVPQGPATSGLGSLNGTGCPSGTCETWCAPCGNVPVYTAQTTYVCQSTITSTLPCEATCLYAYFDDAIPINIPCP